MYSTMPRKGYSGMTVPEESLVAVRLLKDHERTPFDTYGAFVESAVEGYIDGGLLNDETPEDWQRELADEVKSVLNGNIDEDDF